MTLAVAIKAADAIIVAADSRGTIGDPRGLTAVNDTQQKLFQFGNCALALAGSGEVALALLDEFGKRGLNNPQNIDDAVVVFAKLRPGAIVGMDRSRQNNDLEQFSFSLGTVRLRELQTHCQ